MLQYIQHNSSRRELFSHIHRRNKEVPRLLKEVLIMTDFHRNLIPGLDALIGDPDILNPTALTKLKANTMIIPAHYIDRCRQFRDELSNRGEAATHLIHSFARILETIHQNDGNEYICDNGMHIIFQKELDGKAKSTAETTVMAARWFIEHSGREDADDVAILTGDNTLVALASLESVDVAHVNPESYTGRRKIKLTADAMNIWCRRGYLTLEEWNRNYPEEKALNPNEFVEFEYDDEFVTEKRHFTYYIGRFHKVETEKGEEQAIEQIHYIHSLPKFINLRTVGQAMFAEALLAPVEEIPIVICPSTFGTGKTFLATNIGAQLTIFEKKPRYEGIFICPRDSELGKEIGFLPGSEADKTIAKAMPIVDNFETYLKLRKDKEKGGETKSRAQIKKDIKGYLDDYFEFVSVINMGGRSISDKWIIYDEAQELERFQINQLMKRVGDGSKLIIIGDPEQIFNRHLNKQSNGLSYAATKMRGSEYAAIISMTNNEITRSKAAQEIAKFVG